MHFRPFGHHHWHFAVSPIFLAIFLIFDSSTIFGQNHKRHQHSFRENCADEHDKDLLTCIVSSVDCSLDMEKLFPPTESTAIDGFPDEGHDLRIEPFAKAITRQKSENGGPNGQQSVGDHQLMVDISWQTAPNNSTRSLKAFLLEIEGENGRKHACFLLNVSATNWNQEAINASPRLHFSTLAGGTELLFNFGQTYEIELYSLPERSSGSGSSVHSRFVTPHNPNPLSMPANCSKISNQFASKWTAGFRHIFVHSAARILQVEFVGAPPQYCFEQYEVRLLDESGMELLYSGTVSADEMYKNGSLILGQYNFTDLEYDQSYIPSVIPVERAADGRCLCPAVFGTDPYDVKIVCSCVAADWKPVRMNRPDVVKLCPGCTLNNSMAILPQIDFDSVGKERKTSILWILLLIFNALFLLLIFLLVIAYIRCRLNGTIPRKDQFRRIRLLPPNANKSNSSAAAVCSPSANSGTVASSHSLAIRTDLALGTVSASSSLNIPLIGNEEQQQLSSASSLNLLIVYAHDCAKHEQAVMALAEFLRDTFYINVQLDRWNIDQIEANLTDWLSASVVSADKVLIINSAGVWERYRAKITSQGRWAVERKEADMLDHIFCAHIDMALQHHSIVSARFAYSPANQIVPMLDGLLQYILPDNICPLISALFGHNMRQDGRLATAALEENEPWRKMHNFVEAMEIMCREEPNWLSESHQRIACKPRAIMANANQKMEEIEKEFMVEIKAQSKGEEEEEMEEEQKIFIKPAGNGVEPKMDSGIFDWTGSEEEVAAGTSASKCQENTVGEESTHLNPEAEFQVEIAATEWNGTKGEEELADSGVMVSGEDSDAHGTIEDRIRHHQKQQTSLSPQPPISQPPPFFAAAS